MYVVDAIGLIVSICLVGLRYPHHVILACLINQVGQVIVALFFHFPIEGVLASGVFSQVQVTSQTNLVVFFLTVSGIVFNYAIGKLVTGFEFEPSSHIFHSFAKLRSPFAVINIRFAFFMMCVQIFHYISSL